jgi:hypothetical protein
LYRDDVVSLHRCTEPGLIDIDGTKETIAAEVSPGDTRSGNVCLRSEREVATEDRRESLQARRGGAK